MTVRLPKASQDYPLGIKRLSKSKIYQEGIFMFYHCLHFFSSKSLRRQRGFAYLMAVVIILLLPAVSMAASQVTLAWTANSEASLAGYRIYYKSGSSGEPYNGVGLNQGSSPVEIPLLNLADSGNPEVTLTGLAQNTDYYFVATAYDKYGSESDYSNEVVLKADPLPSPVVHKVSASASGKGTISPAGTTTVDDGDDLPYTFKAAAHHHIAGVIVDGKKIGTMSSYTFSNITADHTIAVNFAPDSYTISTSSGGNGSIEPNGETAVEYGTSLTLKLTPDTGYGVADVIIDGTSKGAVRTYTFDKVTANHTITARFKIMDISEPVIEFGELKIDHRWTRILFREKFIDPVVVAGPLSLNGVHPAVVRINNVDSTGFDIRIQEWPYLDGSHVTESVSYMVMERGSYILADGTRIEASTFTTAGTYNEQAVLFEQSYNHVPVVVSSVLSFSGTETVVPRLSNINTEGFGFRLQTQEADRPAAPGAETIAYIAWEPTSGILNGVSYEISTSGDVVTDAFKLLTFTIPLNQAPVFIADMQSFNGGDTAWIRRRNKKTTSIQVQIDEEQSSNQEVGHVAENIGYILLSRVIVGLDSDNDGLKDADEMVYGTDPQKADSDNDGLDDAVELAYWGERWDNDADNDGLINLLDEDSDNDGVNDGAEIDSGSDPGVFDINPQLPHLETGQVQLNHRWTRVTLESTFQHPVVVAGPLSHKGENPSVVRIRNVNANGFDIRIQEWEYLDGAHLFETVGYLVIEQGRYQLSDGTRIEAAMFETDATSMHQPVSFTKACRVAPVVMTTITTFNGPDAVTGRIQKVTPQGFEYLMQEQEAKRQIHTVEAVAYLAWEPSTGSVGDLKFLVARTADEVTQEYFNIMFPQPFTAAPAFLGDMQTTNSADTANIRRNNLDGFAVDVMIDEERSRDTEDHHAAEVVGYMVFGQ
jgi:hypothetical protein